jgi:hypothetical protein
MTCPFFVDLQTGKVTFDASLQSVNWNDAIPDLPGIQDPRLIYRADSRLLAVVGIRNEDLRTSGISLFEWRVTGLNLIRYVPDSALCHYREGPGSLR